MKIAVCDDEEKIRNIIMSELKSSFPDDEIISFGIGEDVLRSVEQDGYMPNIILLDIMMPGVSGMDVARKLRDISDDVVIIFITGEKQYVFDAFDVRAFHFLVKPFSNEKLVSVIKAAKEEIAKATLRPQKKYVMLNSRGSHIRLCASDIIFAEVYGARIIVHTRTDEIEYYGHLSELEKLVGDGFFRTHRGYLVNLRFVKKYDAGKCYMSKGEALISKQNYKVFVKALIDYNKKRAE
ncbi:LytTR family DNA-binding domain-containing protein [Butyrivibrio sp. INlla16]|uniref:LytR/AlgR family response regulator transcription factor n=1 Tax=Butyrivibrio sp. INlla16 TaxID=1520807 RepID=UPI0008857F3A|nr:LytTR family DNA-binding domain-containing protein [Butyrivibrio sp. INlla16]SDB26023.1 two component transcriptional regulator, LytTR family [Butyrivibrio sp. INlla16]